MNTHKKNTLEAKLSSHDQGSLMGDMGFPSDQMPIADMLQTFKDHIEKEEAEEADKHRKGQQSQIANPDQNDAMINTILKKGKKTSTNLGSSTRKPLNYKIRVNKFKKKRNSMHVEIEKTELKNKDQNSDQHCLVHRHTSI